jgi:hypothetical protein
MQISDGLFGKQFNDNEFNKTWHGINVGNTWVIFKDTPPPQRRKNFVLVCCIFLINSNQSYIYRYDLCFITETKAHQ